MWFRSIIAALACSLLAAPLGAAEQPYRVSLVGDRFDGEAWRTGVLIELAPGWKTYWRMPGEAGIPPEFTWTTSLPAKVEVAFPTPGRHQDASGETVGYETAALFPVRVSAGDATALDVSLDLFFAVCKDICIPATAKATIALGPMMRDPLGSARVEQAWAAIPAKGSAITAASVGMQGGKPVLTLELKERPEDIFVESTTSAYFRAPHFSPDGRQASLAIDNVKDAAQLAGASLTFTYRLGGQGFEQALTLP